MIQRVAISSDHGGHELRLHLMTYLSTKAVEVLDLGPSSPDSVDDYAHYAHDLANTVLEGKVDAGILVCGTGIGMSITVNKHKGIRAALCTNACMAKLSRAHNDANVLCLGERIIGRALAEDIVDAFIEGQFDGGRHARRIELIEIK